MRKIFQYKTELVERRIDFIDDNDLKAVIEDRLSELERVFSVNGHLSTIILSISCIEGIFRHLARIFKSLIEDSNRWPKNNKGEKKKLDDLTIEVIYKLLLEKDVLKEIENFEGIYALFRKYRNFIHPDRQKKESWPVGLGQAQMALGLLNATIEQISTYIFIGSEIFEIISGIPRIDMSRILHLDISNIRTNSFVVLRHKIDTHFNMKFDLELGQNILNFVFNFVEDGNFKMLRLDNRGHVRLNCVLRCTQKNVWREILFASPPRPPEKDMISVRIEIDFAENIFAFYVDDEQYVFTDIRGEVVVDLFKEIKPNLRVGFFNEIGPVKLYNIRFK